MDRYKFKEYLWISVAYVVIKNKPTHLTAFEYVKQLQYSTVAKCITWYSERRCYHETVIREKEKLLQDYYLCLPQIINIEPSIGLKSQAVLPKNSSADWHLKPHACGTDYYESILDACLVLNAYNKTPKFSSKSTHALEELLHSIHLLLFALQRNLAICSSSTRLISPPDKESLDQVIINTLIHLDKTNVMVLLKTQVDIPLRDFFKNWITLFVMQADACVSTNCTTNKTRRRAIEVLHQLSNGSFLRKAISHATVDVLRECLQKMTKQSTDNHHQTPLRVSTIENISFAILLLGHLQNNQLYSETETNHNDQLKFKEVTTSPLQSLFGDYFPLLLGSFPLLVNRMCRLAIRAEFLAPPLVSGTSFTFSQHLES